jgi:GNAT superfamily N-acetyltransferase
VQTPRIRIASPDEVAVKFLEVFGTPPPQNSFIALAEHDGEVVGFATLQPIWHIEPMWIDPRWRGRGVFQRLLGLLVPCLPEGEEVVLCFTECSRAMKFFARLGGEYMKTWKMFRWRVKNG